MNVPLRGITGVAILVALTLLGSGCAFTGFRSFGPGKPAAIPTDRLFDVGVADFDEDGRLDIFTVNHKFPGAWLRNAGGRFKDVTAAIGAVPDPEFPGLDGLTAPDMSEPGLYLYMTDSREGEPGLLHIRTVGVAASGKVGFLSDSLRVRRAKGVHISLGKNEQSVIVVRFDARPGAAIVLDPSAVADAPMAAFIDEPADPGLIKVGADAESPARSTFVSPFTIATRSPSPTSSAVPASTRSSPAAGSVAASASRRSGGGSTTRCCPAATTGSPRSQRERD